MEEDEFIKVATAAGIEVAKDIYQDAAKGATVEAGESLQAIVGLFNNVVLFPIKKANINYRYKLEEFEKDLRRKIEKIPQEKIGEPDLTISGPTIEALKYTFDTKEIREMYLNLLASSMNQDIRDKAHPAFVEIIKNMSAFDAKIFELFSTSSNIPIAAIRITTGENYFLHALPQIFSSELFLHGDPFELSRCLLNLERLAIIKLRLDRYLPNYNYTLEESHQFIQGQFIKYANEYPSDNVLCQMQLKGYTELTGLGKALQACCFDNK